MNKAKYYLNLDIIILADLGNPIRVAVHLCMQH